jgi:hypothetical protein
LGKTKLESRHSEAALGRIRSELHSRRGDRLPGDVFEIYVRQECGELAYLSARHPCSADENMSDHLNPIYFVGL